MKSGISSFGVLQCDAGPAWRSKAEAVTSELGGLSLRNTPKGCKQAQRATGRPLCTERSDALQCRVVRAFSTSHLACASCPRLASCYLQNVQGTTAFERRWGRRHNSAWSRFGETVLFRRAQRKASLPGFTAFGLARTQFRTSTVWLMPQVSLSPVASSVCRPPNSRTCHLFYTII